MGSFAAWLASTGQSPPKNLPDEMRWLTRTRLCWQRKKSGKLRPIKMGEFIRSSYAKKASRKHIAAIRRHLRSAHQWGVGVPGACEAMGHWRTTTEQLCIDGTLPPMVAADLDIVNRFGNCEWASIRAAIGDELRY